MKLKEIYKENLGRKYRNVIDTKGNNVQINSSPIKIFKEHKYPIITGILLVILLILLAFRNNLDIFLIVLAFLAFFVGLSIYFNNYKIDLSIQKYVKNAEKTYSIDFENLKKKVVIGQEYKVVNP